MFAFFKSLCLILLVSLAAGSTVLAQMSATGAFAPPSANNVFMGNSGHSSETVDVDLYTGGALVNIPICSLPGKQLSMPITLNYTGGRGIRLQQYATQVGLGWQINAGGNVSRAVRGFPDENSNGYIGGGWGNVLNAAGGNTSALSSAQQGALGMNSSSAPTADGEPDQFNVTTPYFSFQFTFDGNGNPVFSNNIGYKVQWLNHVSFIVTDDQGNQYFFGSSSSSTEQSYSTIYGTPLTFTTTWYLDKIVAYNSSETMTLTYFTYGGVDYNYHYYTQYAFDNNGGSHSATTNIPITYAILSPKYVYSITSAQGEMFFNYQQDRQDDHAAARLTGFSNGSTSYTFNYSYFGAPSTDTNVLRLCLNNITSTGGGSGPLTLYSFTYNLGNTLPSRQSQNFDFWGYYTTLTPSTANPMVTPSARQPNVATTETDVLTSITDIQGETYNIGYELNTWYNAGNVTIGGLRVNQIFKVWNGIELLTQYSYNNSSGNSTGQVYNTINTSGGIVTAPYNNLTYYEPYSGNLAGENYSESPYLTYDLLGNFVGYSAVKVTNPNGSYTIFQFSNFNTTNSQDEAFTSSGEITSAASKSYKRGLLTEKTLYTAAGNKISDDTYNYSTLNTSVTATSWGYHWLLMALQLSWCNTYVLGVCVSPESETITDPSLSGYYTSFVENYRLNSAVHTDYDQLNPANSVATTTTYGYDVVTDATNTNRLVSSMTTTDSKLQSHTQTYFYPIDVYKTGGAAIPLLTAGETTALNTMLYANVTSPIVHSIDNRNGTQMIVHNSYANAINNKTFLATGSTYKNDPANPTNTLASQQSFNYDPATANAISTNSIGGKSSSVLFGYSTTLPIAKVENASSSSSASVATGGFSYTVPNGTTTTIGTYPFSVVANGTINVMLTWPSLPPSGSSNTAQVTYTLTGPAGFTPITNGTICISSNFNCSGYTNTVTDPLNCIAGNYVLTITNCQNPQNNFTLFQVNYPGTMTNTMTNEFFFEGFESDGVGNLFSIAHTGTTAYTGSYTVPFSLPNGRSYILQYWSYNGSAWVFNQQSYTGSVTLSGEIDDVRVFPSDALMTSYTYTLGVGETSETDPSGHSTIYQYDGFNRLTTVRDQDNNILKQYDYEFQACAHPVYNIAASNTYIRNNCSGSTPYGSEVTYNVPAGKYSACSLTAANQLATNDLAYNGQNYANATGSCSATAPCIPPINVAVSVYGAQLTVTWTYPPGVGTNAYAVIVKNAAGTTVEDPYGTASPTTITGLAYNTTYTVTVLSLCSGSPGSTPIPVTTGAAVGQAVNLTNLASSPSGFCCHGCQYTSTVYSNTSTIAPGSLLYTDQALTQPLTGMTFIYPYNNNTSNYIYQLSGNTVTSTTVACH